MKEMYFLILGIILGIQIMMIYQQSLEEVCDALTDTMTNVESTIQDARR